MSILSRLLDIFMKYRRIIGASLSLALELSKLSKTEVDDKVAKMADDAFKKLDEKFPEPPKQP